MRLTIFLKVLFQSFNSPGLQVLRSQKPYARPEEILKLEKDAQSDIDALVEKESDISSRLKSLEIEFGQCSCRSGMIFIF